MSLDKSNEVHEANKISSRGIMVLAFLAIQNCVKNLLTRYVMGRTGPKFLVSAAVIGAELTKITLSILYIFLVDRRSPSSIIEFFVEDWWNTMLLVVPAAAYACQQGLEYVALKNLDASIFVVLIQVKLVVTAAFAVVFLRKKFNRVQVISLVVLIVGISLCSLKESTSNENSTLETGNPAKGISVTITIALISGFCAAYTEMVIKKERSENSTSYSLAYVQVQLAFVTLFITAPFAYYKDSADISNGGLWQHFDKYVVLTVATTGIAGLAVAGVLKYSDSVLKGYAGGVSVVITGILNMWIFGTTLGISYYLGMTNVLIALILYNDSNLYTQMC